MPPLPLSIAIVTCNEEENLERCLASAHELAGEIVIVDSGSTDGTPGVAEKYHASFVHQDWLGFRDQKNVALGHCTKAWVLALDSDEELSPELKAAIEEFFQSDHERFHGARCNRRVFFLGRWIYHGDWYPDRKLRLFRRDSATWGGSPEHDRIELSEGEITQLSGDLNHYSFPTMNSYVDKINRYSDVFLERELAAGHSWSLASNLFRPGWRFLRAYVLRRGFLDGFPGLWIALGVAWSTFVRHSRTYEHEKDR
ncbi:MAG: glycosyltransferase family 2 protein [Verrucomicrobiales bacterium]